MKRNHFLNLINIRKKKEYLMQQILYIFIITICLALIGCGKPEVLIWSYDYDDEYNIILKRDSEIIIKVGEKIIQSGKVEGDLDAPWQYLRKSNLELFNGLLVSYYDNGTLKDRGMVKNGLDHGLYEEFFSDGTIMYSSNSNHGILEGLALDYSDGKVIGRQCFKNGEEVKLTICE